MLELLVSILNAVEFMTMVFRGARETRKFCIDGYEVSSLNLLQNPWKLLVEIFTCDVH
jgi:hypothetical protein